MKKFSNFLDKIPFISNLSSHKESAEKVEVDEIENKYAKAMGYLDQGLTEEAVKLCNQVIEEGFEDPKYKQHVSDCLKSMGKLYETGVVKNCKIEVDAVKATEYYEKYLKIAEDGEITFRLGIACLDRQSFSKAMTYLEKAADLGVKSAYMKIGGIYEEGLNRVDQYGNKSDFVIPIDLEKAMSWYKKLADQGDSIAQAAYDRVEYKSTHTDSIQFEEMDKIYTQVSQKRRDKGVEFKFKVMEAAKLQYQYVYIQNQVEGYMHKMPKDWVKCINEETDEEYYAPSHTYKDFAIYVSYDSLPKESKRDLEGYLRYENEAIDSELNIKSYITEFSDGICTTYFHKELGKGIVTFAFSKKNRLACMRFVCASMEIIEQYEEIIFEVANSFVFVNPTLVSAESANRKEMQYYHEAVYYYYMENYEEAMNAARKALQNGSRKASYLLIELYFDDDSPYRDINKAVNYAQQLFSANKDSDLAFLIGNIYDQHLKQYVQALNWYEEADKLGHKRVPFYLGRFYYYGVLRTMRNGQLALEYFKRAMDNGILEAEAYIHDIEDLGEVDLQETINEWESQITMGNMETALMVAHKKKDQVFYMASDDEIEEAFKKAYGLGSIEAAYELGKMYKERESQEYYGGEKLSMDYFVKAYDANYEDFSKDLLFDVIEYKVSLCQDKEGKVELYLQAAKRGFMPAIEKIIGLVPEMNTSIQSLYQDLRDGAKKGDAESLSAMGKLEKQYRELLILNVDDSVKVIENKFFRVAVPKECIANINDEGGTIRLADCVVEFAVAEMPVNTENEEDYLKVFKLIMSEYLDDEGADILVINSRMIGSAMTTAKAGTYTYSILLISSRNQYLFKLSARDRRELRVFKDKVTEIAMSMAETGEIYVATGDKANKNIGLTLLLSANENGVLSISKGE